MQGPKGAMGLNGTKGEVVRRVPPHDYTCSLVTVVVSLLCVSCSLFSDDRE